MTDDNIFRDPTAEEDKRFWSRCPRWRLYHNWDNWHGLRAFCLLNFWWQKPGPIGITLFNLVLEFNPYHKKEAE